MNLRHSGLAVLAGAALVLTAAPAVAQNTADTVDNAIDDIGNTASDVGNSVVAGANSIGNAADNAVDVDIDVTAANSAAGDLGATGGDANLVGLEPVNDTEIMTTTTTTTTQRESSGKGSWGLLGLAGLLSFLFRPKKPAIHLDERDNTRV